MSKKDKKIKELKSTPVQKQPSKDQLLKVNAAYIRKLEQTVAEQAVTIARLQTDIELNK